MHLTSVKRVSEMRATLGEFPKEWEPHLLRGATKLVLPKSLKLYVLSGSRMVSDEHNGDYFCLPQSLQLEISKRKKKKAIKTGLFVVIYGGGALILFILMVLFLGAVTWKRWDLVAYIVIATAGILLLSRFLERRGFWKKLTE